MKIAMNCYYVIYAIKKRITPKCVRPNSLRLKCLKNFSQPKTNV